MFEKFQFKKKFGQNFLTNNNVVKKIVNSVPIVNKTVYEIGPGHGKLTNFLIKKFHVKAIEMNALII